MDYNTLNILAEFQTFNLEFAKHDLSLNDQQTANLLQMFWDLIDFDPDQKPAEQNSQPKKSETQEYSDNDPNFHQIVVKKFQLFSQLLLDLTNQKERRGLTKEEAKRVALYTQKTYFKHIRLYDFVF